MRTANQITITAYAKPEEDAAKIKNNLKKLIPFEIEQEKIQIREQKAKGFSERIIIIYTTTLKKESHIKKFLQSLINTLTPEQKKLLWKQAETRLDENNHFYIRIDKEALYEDRYIITDLGNCYHIEIAIAAFPATRENALKVVETILYPVGRE